MMTLLLVLVWVLAGIVIAACLYRAAFAAAYLLLPDSQTESKPKRERRFAVIIPAHDEELLIEEVLRTIRAAHYEQERIQIFVIADNCTDRTADPSDPVARQAVQRDGSGPVADREHCAQRSSSTAVAQQGGRAATARRTLARRAAANPW